MEDEWFKPWDRPEYEEWAKAIPEGYLLHILRKEQDKYLVVQAQLVMGNEGLPAFKIIEQGYELDRPSALEKIQLWKRSVGLAFQS